MRHRWIAELGVGPGGGQHQLKGQAALRAPRPRAALFLFFPPFLADSFSFFLFFYYCCSAVCFSLVIMIMLTIAHSYKQVSGMSGVFFFSPLLFSLSLLSFLYRGSYVYSRRAAMYTHTVRKSI